MIPVSKANTSNFLSHEFEPNNFYNFHLCLSVISVENTKVLSTDYADFL